MRNNGTQGVRALALLILCAALFCTGAHAAAAEPEPVLTVTAPELLPAVGESFTVTVEICGNPGLSAVQFTLAYDRTALECSGIVSGPVLRGMMAAVNPDDVSGAGFAAISSGVSEGDGTLAEYSFTVKRAAACTFTLKNIVLSDAERNKLTASVTDSGTVKPQQPAGDGTAEAPQPVQQNGDAPVRFPDVSEDEWSAPFIAKAVDMGLFGGYPDGSFRPEAVISRAEFVTVLWRSAGSPEAKRAAAFADVPQDAYFAGAVAWAAEKGYVNGVSAESFDPDGVLERQAAMSILFRCAGSRSGPELLFTGVYDSSFADSGEIASWAKPAMYWAYHRGLISGVGNGCLSPATGATRAQIAKILVNYLETPDAWAETV